MIEDPFELVVMESVALVEKLLLSSSHLLILIVHTVEDVGPGAFLTVDTLRFAVALPSVDLGKVGRLYRVCQLFGRTLTSNVDQLG